MDHKFKLGKTIYLVILFVLIIGLLLGVFNSTYILKYLPNQAIISMKDDEHNITRLSEETLKDLTEDEYLILFNEEDSSSIRLKDNISQTLAYMKKKTTAVTLSNIPASFNHYKNVVITFEEISAMPNLQSLEEYTADGGNVFFAIRPEIKSSLQNLYRKLGIYEVGEFVTPNGIRLTSNVLIKQEKLTMKNGEIPENSSLSVSIDDHCTIYAESMDHVPLLWDTTYKKGKFMVFNGTMLETRENRGLITGAFSLMNEDFIYPIIDMKVVYIDDFPAPIPEGKNKMIYEEYRRDTPSFYQDIWWPEMQKVAAKYDVKYTGLVIQTYNDEVTPPFRIDEHDRNTFVQFGRELLKMGGEVGIHGYNHQSLTVNQNAVEDLGYHAWGNQADMESSLNIVENYVKELFPNYDIKTYVPPSNRIDQVGEAALSNAIPSINILSSLYIPDSMEYSTVHEFDKGETYIHFPRITSGYEYTKKKRWTMANAVTSIGVFSHFIHPDDILDDSRSAKKKWSDLGKEYNRFMSDIHSNYPWLKSSTARNAGMQLTHFLRTDVYIEEKKDRIIVHMDKFSGELNFILRTKKKIGKLENCEVQKVDEDVYLVKAKKATIKLRLVD
ncbi:DUF2194 domain-containing protein [Cytobacillus massiliigabonensis]|uniref:DUF2194 domain-containing protein n=1 Tax=Cytobacillus massiliigabonensis TaxID=1871011 RepID=UPI0015E13B32|nr:DUF2194 domain-containing protein [Cytobacillus massiliigabonensis]